MATKALISAYSNIAAPLLLPSSYRMMWNGTGFTVDRDIRRDYLIDLNELLRTF